MSAAPTHTLRADGIYFGPARVVTVRTHSDAILLSTLGERRLPKVIALQVVALLLKGLIEIEDEARVERAVCALCGADA